MHILLSYKYCPFARIMIPCPCLWKYLTYSICFSPSLNSLFAYLTLPFILHYQCNKAVPVIIASTFASVILRYKWRRSFPIYFHCVWRNIIRNLLFKNGSYNSFGSAFSKGIFFSRTENTKLSFNPNHDHFNMCTCQVGWSNSNRVSQILCLILVTIRNILQKCQEQT